MTVTKKIKIFANHNFASISTCRSKKNRATQKLSPKGFDFFFFRCCVGWAGHDSARDNREGDGRTAQTHAPTDARQGTNKRWNPLTLTKAKPTLATKRWRPLKSFVKKKFDVLRKKRATANLRNFACQNFNAVFAFGFLYSQALQQKLRKTFWQKEIDSALTFSEY